eukprot:2072512-Rhodomonas_salina.2
MCMPHGRKDKTSKNPCEFKKGTCVQLVLVLLPIALVPSLHRLDQAQLPQCFRDQHLTQTVPNASATAPAPPQQ